jgi:hypothetical protein
LKETRSGRDRLFGGLLCTESCGKTSVEKDSWKTDKKRKMELREKDVEDGR